MKLKAYMPKVDAIFAYLLRYKRDHNGNSPTIRQIKEACGISSVSMVTFYLDRLENMDWIKRDKNKACSIEIVGSEWEMEEYLLDYLDK